jgi:hypothetical protein
MLILSFKDLREMLRIPPIAIGAIGTGQAFLRPCMTAAPIMSLVVFMFWDDFVYRSSFHPFHTNSDFKAMDPNPSILQSMLWSPSVSRIFFTFVPALMDLAAPFTGRSLITTIVSPSANTLPLESFTIKPWSIASSSTSHSNPHSGQTNLSSIS